jgi:branched-subunit amino acid ABC-type transport system permease component
MRDVTMAHGSLYLLGGYLALEMQDSWFKEDTGLGLSLSGYDKQLAAGRMALVVVEQNLGVATSLAERQLVMVTGSIATETTAAELVGDPAAQRRYLGVEPLPDVA